MSRRTRQTIVRQRAPRWVHALSLAASMVLVTSPPEASGQAQPEPTDPRIEAVADALTDGRVGDAQRLMAAATEGTERATVFLRLVEVLLGRGNTDAAQEVALGAAESWSKEQSWSDVATLLEHTVPQLPAEARLFALLGRALARTERHASAVGALERASTMRPLDLESRYYLATAYWESADYDRAEATLRAGLDDSRGAFLWRHQLGRLLLWRGRFTGAVEILRTAATLRPKKVDVRLDLARALEGAGDAQAAIEAYRQVVDRDPELAPAQWALAQLLLRNGQREAAKVPLAAFQQLNADARVRTERDSVARARLDQGWDHLRRGELDAAEALFREVGDTMEAWRGLATVHGARGRHDQAVTALERAVVLAPDDAGLRRQLADARYAAQASGGS